MVRLNFINVPGEGMGIFLITQWCKNVKLWESLHQKMQKETTSVKFEGFVKQNNCRVITN